MSVKLFNARLELLALILLTRSAQLAGQFLSVVPDDSYFASPWARETYRRIKELYAAMNASDGHVKFSSLISDTKLSDDTRERIEDGYKALKGVEIDVEDVISKLSRYRTLRGLNELSERINSTFQETSELPDPSTMMEEVRDHLSNLTLATANLETCLYQMGVGSNISGIVDNIVNPQEKMFIPTGIEEFDERNGGIGLGNLVMIVGTTGGGKTLLAQNVAENMALYTDVCYVPLEMTEEEMVARSMAAKGLVPINKVTSGKWTESETEKCIEGLQKYNRKLKKQGRRLGIFSPPTDMSFDEIVTFLHPYDYEVVVIDYVSLLKGADGDDQWRALTNISRQAKIYAKTHKKIVILLAQLSEEGKIRYARGMLENANLAMTFLATEATKAAGELPIVMPKARGYDPTPLVLKINYPCMLVEGSQTADQIADPKETAERKAKRGNANKNSGAKASTSAGKSSYFDDMET